MLADIIKWFFLVKNLFIEFAKSSDDANNI